jgi:hypothetical protein
MVFAVL